MPIKDKDKRLAYQREWYQNQTIKPTTPLMLRKKQFNDVLNSLKYPCVVCGEEEKVCLDFHHIDRCSKRFSVSDYQHAASRVSIEEFIEEINKCVCLCSNCHRKLHADIIHL